ncbi:MAG: hypothetical protein ACOCXA_01795 [Planctomycetota bacterium]
MTHAAPLTADACQQLLPADPLPDPYGSDAQEPASEAQRLSTTTQTRTDPVQRLAHRTVEAVLPSARHCMAGNVMRTNLAMASTFAALSAATGNPVFDGFAMNGLLYAGSSLAIGLATGQMQAGLHRLPRSLKRVGEHVRHGLHRLQRGYREWSQRPGLVHRVVHRSVQALGAFVPTRLDDPLQSVGASAMGVGSYFLLRSQATGNPMDVGLGAFNLALGAWNTFQSKRVAGSAQEEPAKQGSCPERLTDETTAKPPVSAKRPPLRSATLATS